jgi:hypothetical protein
VGCFPWKKRLKTLHAHGATSRLPAVSSVDAGAGGKEHLAQIKLTIADRPKQGSPLAEDICKDQQYNRQTV